MGCCHSESSGSNRSCLAISGSVMWIGASIVLWMVSDTERNGNEIVGSPPSDSGEAALWWMCAIVSNVGLIMLFCACCCPCYDSSKRRTSEGHTTTVVVNNANPQNGAYRYQQLPQYAPSPIHAIPTWCQPNNQVGNLGSYPMLQQPLAAGQMRPPQQPAPGPAAAPGTAVPQQGQMQQPAPGTAAALGRPVENWTPAEGPMLK